MIKPYCQLEAEKDTFEFEDPVSRILTEFGVGTRDVLLFLRERYAP